MNWSKRLGLRKLPDVLSVEEISQLIDGIDLSRREGVRNKAMLETIYSCGLRVTELVELKVSQVDLVGGSKVRVIGSLVREERQPLVKVLMSAKWKTRHHNS